MDQPRIFISHSHEDAASVRELLAHLHFFERQGVAKLDVWDTGEVDGGDPWDETIKKALDHSDVAVLLLSPSFLASDYVVQRELPALLSRHKNEQLPVIPVVVRRSFWSAIPGLAELKFANSPDRPLADLDRSDRDSAYAAIAGQIAEVALAVVQRRVEQKAAAQEEASASQSVPGSRTKVGRGHIFISHSKDDGDFAELLKHRLDASGYEAWIDSDRLEPGLDWRTEIDEAIKSAVAVVVVVSPEARASEYVTYEWAFALGCGIRVVPVMLKATPLHPRLATLQYLDFTNRLARPWGRLLEAVASTEERQKKRSKGDG